ncbi:MAG: hypothetical protein V1767_04945 [Chloroflexota bacterium]
MESVRLRANRFSFHTRIASNGGCFALAKAIISRKAGLAAVRPLRPSSMNSLTTSFPFLAAYSFKALTCADIERSMSCLSDDTRA